jgi:hypothetical protein
MSTMRQMKRRLVIRLSDLASLYVVPQPTEGFSINQREQIEGRAVAPKGGVVFE